MSASTVYHTRRYEADSGDKTIDLFDNNAAQGNGLIPDELKKRNNLVVDFVARNAGSAEAWFFADDGDEEATAPFTTGTEWNIPPAGKVTFRFSMLTRGLRLRLLDGANVQISASFGGR